MSSCAVTIEKDLSIWGKGKAYFNFIECGMGSKRVSWFSLIPIIQERGFLSTCTYGKYAMVATHTNFNLGISHSHSHLPFQHACKFALDVSGEVALVVYDSLPHYGLQPAWLLCPWDSPGKITGVGCHALLQGIFLM